MSSEVLGEILNGVHRSYLVLDLWKTGNLLLQFKLSSAITHVCLRHPQFRHISRIPRLLSNLRALRHLSLCSVTDLLDSPLYWKPVLSTLSPTLETLSLQSTDMAQAFHNFDPASSADRLTVIKSDLGRGQTTWFDLGAIFPRLSRLEMNLPSFAQTLQLAKHLFEFNELDAAGLPSTLRELKVGGQVTHSPSLAAQAGDSWMKRLPRTLERLEAGTQWTTETIADWQDAPPSLEYVGSVTCENPIMSSLAASIPSKVKIGQCMAPIAISHLLPTTIDSLTIGARMMTQILMTSSAGVRNPDWMLFLPRQLTSLKFIGSELSSAIPLSFVTQLPPLLTSLSISSIIDLFKDLRAASEKQGVNVSLLWPKTLQSLTVGTQCTAGDLKLFPRTLTTLEAVFKDKSVAKGLKWNFADFPRNLTTCCLGIHGSLPVAWNIIALDRDTGLPSSLTSFGRHTTIKARAICTTRQTIEEKFPSSLTDLNFRMPSQPMPNETPWTLPSQLITLSMSQWRVEWLGAIPRQLTSLSISELAGFSEPLASGLFDIFAPLPTSLTSLLLVNLPPTQLGPPSNLRFSTSSLASLSQLRELNLSQFSALPSSIFNYIPRSMRHLKICLESDHLEDASFLPAWLHTCELKGFIDWNSTTLLSHWPRLAPLPIGLWRTADSSWN